MLHIATRKLPTIFIYNNMEMALTLMLAYQRVFDKISTGCDKEIKARKCKRKIKYTHSTP